MRHPACLDGRDARPSTCSFRYAMRMRLRSEKGRYSNPAVAAKAAPKPIFSAQRTGALAQSASIAGLGVKRCRCVLGGWSGGVAVRLHGSYEAVAAAGYGLHKTGVGGVVAEGFAQLVYGGVETVVEIDEGVVRPQFAVQVFARDHFAGTLEQHGKDSERLLLETDAGTVLAQLAGDEVYLKGPKTHGFARACFRHRHDNDAVG